MPELPPPVEGQLPWRLRALFTVVGASAALKLLPPVEAVPSQPLEKRQQANRPPAWIGGRVPPDVSVEDHVSETPSGPLRIRLYRPPAVTGRLPVLAYAHGGGWVTGSVQTTDTICAALALQAGTCVASIDYRLAPDAPYPAALDDVESGVRWLLGNAESLFLDTQSLSIGGDSAGGNLAAALAIRLRDLVPLRAQVLIYPVLDATLSCPSVREFNGWGLRLRDMTVYRDAYAGEADRSDPELSPLLVDDVAGLAPAYVVTAGLDCLRDEGRRYAARLAAAGVTVEYVHYPHLPHGFMGLAGLCPEAGQVLTGIATFLRRSPAG